MNYVEENDSEGEIYLTTRSGKSYNVKNFNSFIRNKDKDDKEIKRRNLEMMTWKSMSEPPEDLQDQTQPVYTLSP